MTQSGRLPPSVKIFLVRRRKCVANFKNDQLTRSCYAVEWEPIDGDGGPTRKPPLANPNLSAMWSSPGFVDT